MSKQAPRPTLQPYDDSAYEEMMSSQQDLHTGQTPRRDIVGLDSWIHVAAASTPVTPPPRFASRRKKKASYHGEQNNYLICLFAFALLYFPFCSLSATRSGVWCLLSSCLAAFKRRNQGSRNSRSLPSHPINLISRVTMYTFPVGYLQQATKTASCSNKTASQQSKGGAAL